MNTLQMLMILGYGGSMFWLMFAVVLIFRIDRLSKPWVSARERAEVNIESMEASRDAFIFIAFVSHIMGGICHLIWLATLLK